MHASEIEEQQCQTVEWCSGRELVSLLSGCCRAEDEEEEEEELRWMDGVSRDRYTEEVADAED